MAPPSCFQLRVFGSAYLRVYSCDICMCSFHIYLHGICIFLLHVYVLPSCAPIAHLHVLLSAPVRWCCGWAPECVYAELPVGKRGRGFSDNVLLKQHQTRNPYLTQVSGHLFMKTLWPSEMSFTQDPVLPAGTSQYDQNKAELINKQTRLVGDWLVNT